MTYLIITTIILALTEIIVLPFAKPKKQEPIQPTYVFKSWELRAISYNRKHGLPDDAI